MGIAKIEISNYKSIKKCSLDITDINLLIGENGCGKSSILSAVKFFMQNLGSDEEINECGNIFDMNNPFSNCVKISIYFDMSKFRLIASNQLLKNDAKRYRSYYLKIMKLSVNKLLKVSLTKIKDKRILWNIARNDRKILSSIFPVYFLDSRRIDLFDWSELWYSIGDLIKLDNDISMQFQEAINKHMDECNDPKFLYALRNINNIIQTSPVQILQYSPKEYSNSLLKTYLQGDTFTYKTKKLTYFSNGTNAYNYTIFLLDILELISKTKLKTPTIVLDEPELSLHHSLVDNLSNKIFESGRYIKTIASTHSPRLVKNVLQDSEQKKLIYHVKLKNNYSKTSRMKLFTNINSREKTFITDDHSNAYFSKILLCVEGESDLGFFSNKYIRDIYPILNSVDIYKSMSNKVIENIIHPQKRKYSTPCITLLDMDKVLNFDLRKSKFKLDCFFIKSKEAFKFQLSYKTARLNYIYKRITGIVDKSNINFNEKWGFCEDDYYFSLVKLLKEYFASQSTFINATTIEGMIVTKDNFEIFTEFFTSKLKNNRLNKFQSLYNCFDTSAQKCNFLRLVCNGKSDTILNTDKLKLSRSEKTQIEELRQRKTDGWMSEFIEFYVKKFFSQQGLLCSSFQQYKSIIYKKPDLKEQLKSNFYNDFKELSSLIRLIESNCNVII
ncbi:retron Eco8 family effector endonuclease [Clostridium sp. BNL1100]|uniref:retron Eco8 family effector endonuclease n=1 Tax=Clostridium sp. BNL1100 TaxID=755731 RepID=UPI00024A78FB|nr:retron Eco8 family effector endonuclease [Clostridium sp. BNL1100]AEY65235.1 putative ATPase [Clostridium sp. BNL1100]